MNLHSVISIAAGLLVVLIGPTMQTADAQSEVPVVVGGNPEVNACDEL